MYFREIFGYVRSSCVQNNLKNSKKIFNIFPGNSVFSQGNLAASKGSCGVFPQHGSIRMVVYPRNVIITCEHIHTHAQARSASGECVRAYRGDKS